MLRYADLGMGKRLNEIVMAGSHDAGITGGAKNAKTQTYDIAGQARAGVRIFDLRIKAATVGSGKHKSASLQAYHSGMKSKDETKTRYMDSTGKRETIVRSKLSGETLGSTWGLGLNGMLLDAGHFVGQHSSEFLIMKFDKCTNWPLIAEYCVNTLGDKIYTDGGNINRKTLQELRGKVVVVFDEDGLAAVKGKFSAKDGILGFRNLYSKDTAPKQYATVYDGLQYFGKGGTSLNPFSTKKGKIAENLKKQTKIMSHMANNQNTTYSSEVLGMMYWTSTGLMESIKKRDDMMWTMAGKESLRKMWSAGLEESISSRLTRNISPSSYSSAGLLKTFMPNFVMVDFADRQKCRTIYELNDVAGNALTQMFQQNDEKAHKLLGLRKG